MTQVRKRPIEKMTDLMFKGMDLMRHKTAFDASAQTPTAQDFSEFANIRQCLLVTYKRSGEAMPTPINFGVADGKLYVRSEGNSGKMKRMRNNPYVVLLPCSFRGKPRGQAISAIARILPESEVPHADAVIAANWSIPMKAFERSLDVGAKRFDVPNIYVEFTPTAP